MPTARAGPTLAFLLLAHLVAPGCGKPSAPPPDPLPGPATASSAAAAAARTTRIVFVDKEECCACTQKRVDDAWETLRSVLGDRTLPVERLHFDTQPDLVAPYKKLRSFFALPAVYFLDAEGGLVELFQGEVDPREAAALLAPAASD